MSRVAIVTDSNSGISQEEAKKLGVYVVPMPFFVNGRVYFEDIDLSQEQFYKLLAEDADVSTSQPSPADIMDLWDDLLRSHQEIVHIPCPAVFPLPVPPLRDWRRIITERFRWWTIRGYRLP